MHRASSHSDYLLLYYTVHPPFFRSTPAVVFWQWANQSFNALVNYTNRNAASELTTKQLVVAYTSATTAALTTALGLKRLLARSARFAVVQVR